MRRDVASSTMAIMDNPHSNTIVLEHLKDPTKKAILILSPQTIMQEEIAMEDLREWTTIGMRPLHQILPKAVCMGKVVAGYRIPTEK
jgi:hypothetical protein